MRATIDEVIQNVKNGSVDCKYVLFTQIRLDGMLCLQ